MPNKIRLGEAIASLSRLSRDVYQACEKGSSTIKPLSSGVLSMHELVDEIWEVFCNEDLSYLQQKRLEVAVTGRRRVLEGLEALIEKDEAVHDRINTASNQTDRPVIDISTYREKIKINISFLRACLRHMYAGR